MSVDTVFKASGPTALVTNAGATQSVNPAGNTSGIASFRVVNLAAVTQRLGWGPTAASVTAVAPTVAGFAGGQFSLVMEPGGVETFEFPSSSFFLASSATGFEMTPGQGA